MLAVLGGACGPYAGSFTTPLASSSAPTSSPSIRPSDASDVHCAPDEMIGSVISDYAADADGKVTGGYETARAAFEAALSEDFTGIASDRFVHEDLPDGYVLWVSYVDGRPRIIINTQRVDGQWLAPGWTRCDGPAPEPSHANPQETS